jgi:RHS repeat-associated protein
MMKYVEKSGNNTHSVGYTYDDINNLTALVETVGNQEYTTSYSYDGDNRLTSLESDNVFQSYTYDAYGRVTQKTAKNGDQTVMDEAITYRNAGPGGITAQPFQLIYTGTNYSTTFGYRYNTNDNITYVNQDGNTTYYYYDSANQLIREDNSTTDTTTLWTYDAAGNILRREVYPFSGAVPDPDAKISQVEYTYGDSDWGDLLTEYNGVEITYDGIGNPVNDGTWTYTWQHGRQLASMAKIDQSETWQFTYNADGLRTQRTNGTTTYKYTYLGGQLTHMTVGEHTMHFTYDGAGSPLSVTYGSETYYYVTNLQGDIVTILESDGTAVVHYAYDAWGNLISTTGDMADTLGFYNPLRYRGYVYDEETELYYLQSRYYNPEIGRFINGDGFASTGQGVLGNNMFAYCANNPVCNMDITGARYIDALSVASEGAKQRSDMCTLQKERILGKLNEATPSAPTATESPGKSTVPEKAKQVAKSIWNNLELSAGVGMGFCTEGELLSAVGLQFGMYANNGILILEDGQFKYGQDFHCGFSASFFTYNIGFTEYAFMQNGKTIFDEISKGFYQDETLTIASGTFYVGGGGSFRIGFDIEQFCYDMWDIF